MIQNPVAHTWSEPQHIKRRFCCVCRKRTDDTPSSECEGKIQFLTLIFYFLPIQNMGLVCSYYVHADCRDLAVSDCREVVYIFPPRTNKMRLFH